MRIVPLIQARMSSRRLPGKILASLGSTTLLGLILENLAHCPEVEAPWIATSEHASDDPVARFAKSKGVACYRGSLNDVALRLLRSAEAAGAAAIVRVNGDSPLLDPALIGQAARLMIAEPVDLVTNVLVRSFPKGQSVEIISRTALAKAVAAMTTPDEREHVTLHFYRHPERYRISSFAAESPRPELQLSVDDRADLRRGADILSRIGRPAWQAGWRACAAAADELAELTRKNDR